VHERERPAADRLAAEPAAGAPAAPALQFFSAIGNAAAARMLAREPDGDSDVLARVRKDLVDNVTNRVVEAQSHVEAKPPRYSNAFIAISQAEGALDKIRGTPNLPPEIQIAFATNGLHIARVQLEALDHSMGDIPAGARSGINQTLSELAPIAAPEAEKRLLGDATPDADPAVDQVRKDVQDKVINRMIEARSHFEATPPDYSSAFVAASQAEGALDKIRGTPKLPGEIQAALSSPGPHLAAVHLEALDYNRGDAPAAVRAGLNAAMHDLSPVAAPDAEKRLLATPTKPLIGPNPFE
jgi:hypothetical protein